MWFKVCLGNCMNGIILCTYSYVICTQHGSLCYKSCNIEMHFIIRKSFQNGPKCHLQRSKIQIFLGGMPPDPLA